MDEAVRSSAFAQLAHLTRYGMTSKLIGVFED